MHSELLPSWREGESRTSILRLLDKVDEVPVEDRVAIFDNDGTLWCEKPNYPQVEFFVRELKAIAGNRPELAERPEYAAILDGDAAALSGFGLEAVALALLDLFDGITPEEFAARVSAFFAEARHPDLGVLYNALVYQPMVELIDTLRAWDFRVFLATAGGADFVRVVSMMLYGVAPEQVVGSRVKYEVKRAYGRLNVVRTARLDGDPNEGIAKPPNIQRQVGRRPIFAAGNSPGDAEMLEYTSTEGGPSLAMLIQHDDDVREYAYESVAGTFQADESILDTASRLGWTVVSMRHDWSTVFGA